MNNLINFIEVIFVWAAAAYLILFYIGKLKYPPKKEKKREEIVGKYGFLIIISIVLCIIGGAGILITSFI